MNSPIIEYPCQWSYRVIGTCEQLLREAVSECIDVPEVDLSVSNHSTKGTYVSMNLTVKVKSELMRDCFFMALRDHQRSNTCFSVKARLIP